MSVNVAHKAVHTSWKHILTKKSELEDDFH